MMNAGCVMRKSTATQDKNTRVNTRGRSRDARLYRQARCGQTTAQGQYAARKAFYSAERILKVS